MTVSLQQSAASGVRWGALNSAAGALIHFAKTAVLARILAPSDFGAMAIVMTLIGFVELIKDFGIGTSLIQRQSLSRGEVSSVFWLQTGFGFLSLCLAALAGVAWMILSPVSELPALFLTAAVGLPIGALGVVPSALAQREFKFRLISSAAIVSSALGAIVAVGSAMLYEQGVWSLVWGSLVATVTSSGVLLVFLRREHGVPSWTFDRRLISDHLRFGLYLFGTRVFNVVGVRSDQLIIGAMLGTEALGYYSVASSLVLMPWRQINPILTKVALPIFARARSDPPKVVNGFLRMIRLLSQINTPLLIGLAATAPFFVPVYLGPQWLPTIPLVQLLSLVGLFRTFGNAAGPFVLAFGRPKALFLWDLFIILTLPPAIFLSCLADDIVVTVIVLAILQPIYIWGQYRRVLSGLAGPFGSRYLLALWPAAISGAVMFVVVSSVVFVPELFSLSRPTLFVLQVAIGALVYTGLLLFVDRRSVFDNVRLLLRSGRSA